MLDLILSTVGQGLQWSVLALGVFLTFRILDIADLSVEGSFPLGAAVAATAITALHHDRVAVGVCEVEQRAHVGHRFGQAGHWRHFGA